MSVSESTISASNADRTPGARSAMASTTTAFALRHHLTRTNPIARTPRQGLDPKVNEFKPAATNLYTSANVGVLLQTARAQVFNPEHPQSRMTVRVILDGGSQRSYITSKARDTLSLRAIHQQKMAIKTFGSREEEEHHCDVVRLAVETVNRQVLQLELFVVPLICEPLSNQPIEFCKLEFQHLAHLQLADSCDGSDMTIDILIRSDHYWEIATSEIVRGKKGPTAINTKLGWVLSGPTDMTTQDSSSVNVVTSHTLRVDTHLPIEEGLDSTLRRFWDLESIGIRNDDTTVLGDFSKRIAIDGGRYQVSLPWKETHAALPDNHQLSLKRLRGLLNRLKHNPPILEEYDSLIKDQLRNGIIERVNESEVQPTGEVHYIPHHAVIRQDKKTTKLRVVYDASARGEGPSLNDCLYAGPKFEQSIMDIILRFRSHKVALIADIEKAFLQISIKEEDRDALRFLWFDDVAKKHPEITTLRFTRVPFGVTSSPFLLNATIQYHLNKYTTVFPETVQKISQSIYVDDIAFGADSDDSAFTLYSDSKTMLRDGGFNLRKFVTNSSVLLEKIEENEGALRDGKQSGDTEDESYTKATLGTTQQMNTGRDEGSRCEVESYHRLSDI